jgi:hypothetical protein
MKWKRRPAAQVMRQENETRQINDDRRKEIKSHASAMTNDFQIKAAGLRFHFSI